MADDSQIVRDRFNQAMQKAMNCADSLSLAQRSHVWKGISKDLDGIRKKGNIMGQSKALTKSEVAESIKDYARRFGEEG